MKNQLLYGGILLLATACSSPKNFSVEDGNTFIVIDEKASVPSVLAAHELQHFVQQASGIELPIVNNAPSNGSKLICVGESPYTAEFDTMKLGEQEYFIKVSSDKVVLMGQDENTDRDDGRDNNGITPSKDRLKVNYSQLVNDTASQILRFMMHRALVMRYMTFLKNLLVSDFMGRIR